LSIGFSITFACFFFEPLFNNYMKIFTLVKKQALLICVVVFSTLTQINLSAQCANNNTLWQDITPASVGSLGTVTSGCMYAGEYCTVTVCEGANYTFSTCSPAFDTQITLYSSAGIYLDFDDDGCSDALNGSELNWTATFTGVVWALLDQYDCLSNQTCAYMSCTQETACPSSSGCLNNNTLYTDLTPAFAGDTQTATCIFGGEYVTADVCAGATYTFATCGTSWDSQLTLYTSGGAFIDYIDDNCDGNNESLTWTATYTGTVRAVVDLYNCLSNATCGSISVTQESSCAGGCNVYDAGYDYVGCQDGDEVVDIYAYFTGACEVYSIWNSVNGGNFVELVMAPGFGSGDPMQLFFPLDNATYDFYFELTDGSLSDIYFYNTGVCDVVTCTFTNSFENYNTCLDEYEYVDFTPFYAGSCSVASMWFNDGAGWVEAVPLGGPYFSGDIITFGLLADFTNVSYYYQLSDGSVSPVYTYSTGFCSDVASCAVTDVTYDYLGCNGTDEEVNFFVYYTGACDVVSLWSNVNGGTYTELALAGGIISGEAIGILFPLDNAEYDFYFELSDGTFSDTYAYFTGNCDNPLTCFNLLIDYNDTGCLEVSPGNVVPSGDITPFYSGGCTVEGVYTSVDGGAFQYLDLSAFNYSSGDAMGLLFNIQDAAYTIYYVLSDGSVSPDVNFFNGACESGITVCDCAGNQVPIEAVNAWLGDGYLDDGNSFWNGTIPVDFSCATWAFDCGDGLNVGEYYYDPYGVCSGNLPPASGCVDEFCYFVDLDVITDCFPEETSIYLYNENGDLVFGASSETFTQDYTQYTFGLCLPAGCYTFSIADNFGDGMNSAQCTSMGAFGVYNYGTNQYFFLEDGDVFSSIYSEQFCVGPQTICDNLLMELEERPCQSQNGEALLPSMMFTFDFDGPCTVASLWYSVNGADYIEQDVTGFAWGNGDAGYWNNLSPNSDYSIYYVTDDGAVSYLYDFTTGDCSNEVTICDCDGTTHSIGVVAWLGDGFADNGFYQWDGQYVNFNCLKWGYDCGDISGAPNQDPYNVCDGQLPPFNGCDGNNETLGCTDPTALNYDPSATINDGSCIYNSLIGCTDNNACNYNETAQFDDGSCEYISCVGCTNPSATNYDPTATVDDGSCVFGSITGCTDPTALNYNPLATVNQGCIYNCIWPSVYYDAHCVQGDLNNFYVDVEVSQLGNGSPYTITNSGNNQQQVMSLTGSFTMGPFPIGTPVVIEVTSNTIDCFLTSQPQNVDCSVGGVYGCTDQGALNYNQNATIDDGSCVYPNVQEIEMGNFILYPNPANEKLIISSQTFSDMVQIRIIDGTGRVVSTQQAFILNGANYEIDTQNLASGNYSIELITGENVEHHLVVIQH
jgi:hypothetical protein